MKIWLPWILFISLLSADITVVRILRQVNNPLGYELISHDEIEAMHQNLNHWRDHAFYYYKKWRACGGN